jgi:hypothetical protein
LETAENKPKTLKATINDLIAFAKTAKIKTRGEIKPPTLEQDAKSPIEEEEKTSPYKILGILIVIAVVFIVIIKPDFSPFGTN